MLKRCNNVWLELIVEPMFYVLSNLSYSFAHLKIALDDFMHFSLLDIDRSVDIDFTLVE